MLASMPERENCRSPRIVALSLTKPSLGNALGIGLADFTTRRVMEEYDPGTTYVNLRIKNTAELAEMWISEALPGEAQKLQGSLSRRLHGIFPFTLRETFSRLGAHRAVRDRGGDMGGARVGSFRAGSYRYCGPLGRE